MKIFTSLLWIISFTSILIATDGHAAGALHLTGTVVAFSPKEVTLEVRKKRLYVIDRTALSNADGAKILKAGIEVKIDVPMVAVKNVKDEKK
jgi:hypothetical protein